MDQHPQRQLFYDNYRAALREDCKAIADMSPAWAKLVGKMLWPGKDPIEAGRSLNDKTNHSRDDRLTEEEERLVMRLAVEKRGFSAAHDYITDEISMERSKPKERKDEIVELLSRAERLVAEQRSVGDTLERLLSSPVALAIVSSNKKSAA